MSGDFSVRITLLDGQLVDCDRLPVGRIDDLEVSIGAERAEITQILTGSQALGERLGGPLGSWMAAISSRLKSRGAPAGPTAIPAELVTETAPMVKLAVRAGDLADVAGLEQWLGKHFVGKLPGTGHASE